MSDGLDDLLGGPEPSALVRRPPPRPAKFGVPPGGKRPKSGRPPRDLGEAEALAATVNPNAAPAAADELPHVREFYKPVTRTFIADVFRLDRRTVEKKLGGCPVARFDEQGHPLYDFPQAAAFVAKAPPGFLLDRLKRMNPKDLPAELSKAFWEAQRVRLKFQHEAGDAWATAKVLEVLGDVFLTIKDTTTLWVETLNDRGDLTQEQWAALMQMVDALQGDLHSKLIAMPAAKQTHSLLVDEAAADEPDEDDEA